MARRVTLTDDAHQSLGQLLKARMPWLTLGLALSIGMTVLVARYEEVLSFDARVAFFMPLIVYISDAVGTQTTTIFVRNLGKKTTRFGTYIGKEFMLGVLIGAFFGAASGLVTAFWLDSMLIAFAVGISMWISISSATVFSLIIATTLYKLRVDPALGADPIITVLQDVVSLFIYLAVVSAILL